MIRRATNDDAGAIARIYNHYIEHTIITFEETPVTAEEMNNRMVSNTLPRLVAEEDGIVSGSAYAQQWRPRSAYRHSVECSVYLDPAATGRGLGKQLYQRLFELLREMKIHTVIGGIALPNDPSVGLHESLGFEKVAHYREVGRKFGQWIDVAYWQLMLK
ncbi:MAG: arsinothricin resistance N-acetyltransferase ArsN1 family B [Limisphaerales bacterium]